MNVKRAGNRLWPLKVSVLYLALVFLCAGRQLLGQAPAQDHPGQYEKADIEYGSRVYAAHCATCHGATGEGVGGVNLRSGRIRRASTDGELRQLITTGIPGTAMPSTKLDNAELAGLIAYLRNMNVFDAGSVTLGDPTRGRAIFEGKGACTTCHRVNDNGSRVGPDLSDIGATRAPSSIQRHLIDPTRSMSPINRPVRAVTSTGRVVNGRRLNEDTYSVQLIDDKEQLVSLLKAELREYAVGTTSPMPSYQDKLSSEELAAVVAYLLTLKGG
jgi:putative heme-binding domain-containing protein